METTARTTAAMILPVMVPGMGSMTLAELEARLLDARARVHLVGGALVRGEVRDMRTALTSLARAKFGEDVVVREGRYRGRRDCTISRFRGVTRMFGLGFREFDTIGSGMTFVEAFAVAMRKQQVKQHRSR